MSSWTHTKWTHAVDGLVLSIQFGSSRDDSCDGIDVEVFPVSVTCPSLQEGVAYLSIHPLIAVCGGNVVHHHVGGLLLQGG